MEHGWAAAKASEQVQMAKLKSNGMQTPEPSAELMTQLRAVGAKQEEEWAVKAGPDGSRAAGTLPRAAEVAKGCGEDASALPASAYFFFAGARRVGAGAGGGVGGAGGGVYCTVTATRSAGLPGSIRTVKRSSPPKPASGM